AIADHDEAVDGAWRTCDRVGVLMVLDRIDGPELRAGLGVELDQPPIERTDIDRALPQRDAAIDHIAASVTSRLARHMRIESPQTFARFGIQRDDLAPRQ